jgi:hypothetical protein
LLQVAFLAILPAQAGGQGDAVPVAGTYVSPGYRYSVIVPAGLRAYRSPAPTPQHGLRLFVDGKNGPSMWVNGEFDVLGLGSIDELAKHQSRTWVEQYGLAVVHTRRVKLAGLEATEVILENRQDGMPGYVRFVLGFRPVPDEVGLVYVVGIQGKSESAVASAAFSELVASFRTID